MDKNVLLLCILLFFLSSQLLTITWDIGKASIYIIVILLILNTINPAIAEMIKTFFKRMLNLDTSLITDGVSQSASFLLDIIGAKNNPIFSEIFGPLKPKSEAKSETKSETTSEGTSLNPKAISPNPEVPSASLENQKSTADAPVDAPVDAFEDTNNKIINQNDMNIDNVDNVLINLPDAL